MFYGVLDDHRDGDGEALVQLEDEVIIEAAQPGRRVAPARDHVFGVKGHSLRAEYGERLAEYLLLARERTLWDQVGRVQHYANQPRVLSELVEQAPTESSVGDDVPRLRLDPEAHAPRSAAGNNWSSVARRSRHAS